MGRPGPRPQRPTLVQDRNLTRKSPPELNVRYHPTYEGGGDSQVRAGEGSNLGLARAAILLRVTRGVYFARTVPNQLATDALAQWAGPPKTTQPLPGVQMAAACPTRGTPSASVATCGGVESPDVHKCNRRSSPLPAFVEDLSLRRPRLGLVAMLSRLSRLGAHPPLKLGATAGER